MVWVSWVDPHHRQVCWAHLIRDFIRISERGGAAGEIGNDLLDYVRQIFALYYYAHKSARPAKIYGKGAGHQVVASRFDCGYAALWRRVRDVTLDRRQVDDCMQLIRAGIEITLHRGAWCGHAKTQRTCEKILSLKHAMWTFITVPGIEPTNNAAERTLRDYTSCGNN